MEQRSPSLPREAWLEKPRASRTSMAQHGPRKVCGVQPLQGPVDSAEDPSASVVSPQEEDPLSCIRACCTRRPQAQAQKLSFLACVRTACTAALKDREAHKHLSACASEVAQCIEELLQEEPADRLDTELRQQAMSAIATMSSAWLLPEKQKNSLLCACLSSVLHLPGYEADTDLDMATYTETMEALHRLLQVLVGSAGTSVLMELQNILELLLPFTTCQLAAVEERAVACIARLLAFCNTCPLPELCFCFTRAAVFQHNCQENQRLPVLGKLAGHLILCCSSTDERTRDEAMKAIHQLFTFITAPGLLPKQKEPKMPQPWDSQQTLLPQEVSHEDRARNVFEVLRKCLLYPETVNILLTAIESMTAPGLHSTQLAAHMVDVLTAKARFPPREVRKIVNVIYSSLPSIRAQPALKSLGRALLVLVSKFPREMVTSLLVCSPTCTRVAVIMWREMLSEPPAVEKVLQQLLPVLRNHSLHHTSPFIKDWPRVLALAAAKVLPEILQLPLVLKEAEAIFPQLFLALLLQVSFTVNLTQQEVEIFFEAHQQHQLTPIRAVVQSLKVLLCSVGLQRQMEAIQEQGGWDALLSTVTHLQGVQVVARVMRELPGALRDPIFHHLVELLSTSFFYSWETVAMVFLIEMLDCVDLNKELHRIMILFTTYLQSQSVGMQQLVLRGILKLSQRQDTARPMIIFLPCVMELLQDADSDIRAVALPILSNLLQLLEGVKLSLMALALAGKLPALINDESSTVRQLSIDLFLETLNYVEDQEKRKMQEEVCRSLVLLYLHLHDEEESVAKASQKALLGAARFLRWRRLEHLVQTAQFWQIGECMVCTFPHPTTGSGPPCANPALFPLQLDKRRRRSAAQEYLGQSLLYLQSPQESLRREAVRFIGLLGQHMRDQEQAETEYIYQRESGSAMSGQPAGNVPVPCSLLSEGTAGRPAGTQLSSSLCSSLISGLQEAQQDPSPFVSSLALQTLKILKETRPRPPQGDFGQLFSRLRSAWRRWRSSRAHR
ncbi:maestro heat-like repeat-containing protein family member 7 isoform X4 [Gallus gallus]|uniref:maestro heat-like repeat-containing protein family member 7 isoform X4 n=2 Tax=Gallus gallus TaxID=9031 RepID=UPI001AE8DF54|nr:maestro heat-like repeat-containing protein family member 7 isoform X4 [Gallus gallus]